MRRSATTLAHLRSRKNNLLKIINLHRRAIHFKLTLEREGKAQYPQNA